MRFKSWEHAVEVYAIAGKLSGFPTKIREHLAQQCHTQQINPTALETAEEWLQRGHSIQLSEIHRFLTTTVRGKGFVFLTADNRRVVSETAVPGAELIGVTDLQTVTNVKGRLYDISQTYNRNGEATTAFQTSNSGDVVGQLTKYSKGLGLEVEFHNRSGVNGATDGIMIIDSRLQKDDQAHDFASQLATHFLPQSRPFEQELFATAVLSGLGLDIREKAVARFQNEAEIVESPNQSVLTMAGIVTMSCAPLSLHGKPGKVSARAFKTLRPTLNTTLKGGIEL